MNGAPRGGDPQWHDRRLAPASAYDEDDDYALPQRVPPPGFDGRQMARFGGSPRVAPAPPMQRPEPPPTRREELLRQPPPMKPLPYYPPPPPPPGPPRAPSPSSRPKRSSSLDSAKKALRALVRLRRRAAQPQRGADCGRAARQSMAKPQNHRLISKGMLLPVSRFMLRWNMALIVMLAYTALLTPYEARAGAPALGRFRTG